MDRQLGLPHWQLNSFLLSFAACFSAAFRQLLRFSLLGSIPCRSRSLKSSLATELTRHSHVARLLVQQLSSLVCACAYKASSGTGIGTQNADSPSCVPAAKQTITLHRRAITCFTGLHMESVTYNVACKMASMALSSSMKGMAADIRKKCGAAEMWSDVGKVTADGL